MREAAQAEYVSSRWLVWIGAGLLLVLGGAKGISLAVAGEQMAARIDPVLRIPLSTSAMIAGGTEVIVGIGCLIMVSRPWLAAWGFVGLGHLWLIYQGIRGILPEPGRCPCLGQLPIWFPWLGAYETPILLSIALWYVLVGWGLVLWGTSNSIQREQE